MTSNSPRTIPIKYSFPNRVTFPRNRLNPAFSYDQQYINALKVFNDIPIKNDETPFLSLFDTEFDEKYYKTNFRNNINSESPRINKSTDNVFGKSDNNRGHSNQSADGVLVKREHNRAHVNQSPGSLKFKNQNLKENDSNDEDSEHYFANYQWRTTAMKEVSPLKNLSVHEYLYSLANKSDQEGYADKYKDIKIKRSKELPKLSESLREYKRFKESAGFGFNFLDPTRSKELTEVKMEKVNKRNQYATYVKERNLAIANRKNTYDPEAYVSLNSLPYLQYSRHINESRRTR